MLPFPGTIRICLHTASAVQGNHSRSSREVVPLVALMNASPGNRGIQQGGHSWATHRAEDGKQGILVLDTMKILAVIANFASKFGCRKHSLSLRVVLAVKLLASPHFAACLSIVIPIWSLGSLSWCLGSVHVLWRGVGSPLVLPHFYKSDKFRRSRRPAATSRTSSAFSEASTAAPWTKCLRTRQRMNRSLFAQNEKGMLSCTVTRCSFVSR